MRQSCDREPDDHVTMNLVMVKMPRGVSFRAGYHPIDGYIHSPTVTVSILEIELLSMIKLEVDSRVTEQL